MRVKVGQLLATPGALQALAEAGEHPRTYLVRHLSGDWGDLSAVDRAENELAAQERRKAADAGAQSSRSEDDLDEYPRPALVQPGRARDRDQHRNSRLVSRRAAPVPIRWVVIRDPENRGRAHLGVETQRQWNEKAIERTTPALLGLFSLVTLLAQRQHERGRLTVRQAAWYVKELPTFSDAIASVRRQLWNDMAFCMSSPKADIQKLQHVLLRQFADALCYAA